MSYKRAVNAQEVFSGDSLTRALAGIGMNFAAEPRLNSNIEDTLFSASIEGLERDDLRVLSILTTWLKIHHGTINADRLFRLLKTSDSQRVRAYWAAIAHWLKNDRRFARLRKIYKGPRVDLLHTGTNFHLQRFGEDERFKKSPMCLPANILRERDGDVLAPKEIAKQHMTYHFRVMMGPSYRADMWAELTREPTLTPSELARRTYGSFATAWQVKKDLELLKP